MALRRGNRFAALAVLMPLVYLILAVVLVASVATSGTYPSGAHAMFHLYRGDAILRSVQAGVLMPYYNTMWFNGTELLRFTPPLPGCLLALCQVLALGSVLHGYLLFLGILFYASAMEWLTIGMRMGRPALGALLGAVWFFLPYHLYMLFVEGDLAWCMGAAMLPGFFYQVERCLRKRTGRAVLRVSLGVLLLSMTQIGLAAMTALCLLVMLAVRCIGLRRGQGAGTLSLAVLAGFLLGGIWIVPYLSSGIMGLDYSEAMAATFQNLVQTLSVRRYMEMGGSVVYFGLSLFALPCFTGVFGKREALPGAWTAIILVLLTTSVSYTVVHIMPGNSYLRMFWVFPAAAAMGFLAFLSWDTLRRPALLLLCCLLAADVFPSLPLITGGGVERVSTEERLETTMTTALLREAQSLTNQRLAILDEGNLGSEGIFLATAWENPVPVSGGDERIYASTRDRLNRISRALSEGGYLYVFDRCMEMGCDTVLIQGGLIPQKDWEEGAVDAAAARLGYTLAASNGAYFLYHVQAGGSWGTVSRYPAVGIGSTAYYTSLFFPAMEETMDTNLNHYTFEQLSRYELILLSGFTYDDRDAAEELILALSQAGVRIVIEADGIPENRTSNDRRFLGTICNDIEFSNGYPELDTMDGILNTDLFPQEYAKWETVYTEGLDQVWGTLVDNDVELPFYGTVKNENIVVIGLNLSFYYALTQDASVGRLLSRAMSLPDTRLPLRRTVSLKLVYHPNGVDVTTREDYVNTTLAWHDFLRSEQELENDNQLVRVRSGTTRIRLESPHLVEGAAVSGAGIVLMLAAALWAWREQRRQDRAGRAEEDLKETEPPEKERGTEAE